MRILGLDPGSTAIGWAVLESISPSCVSMTVVETGKFKASKDQRKAEKSIESLIEIFQPNAIAFELTGPFLKGTYRTVVEQGAQKALIPVLGCKVSDIREYLYGNANASKIETNYILRGYIFNLRPGISKDELDAISVGLYALKIRFLTDND